MKINIEIDVTPAELRQFLGLPDVAGLQEDMIEYVRGRVARGAETFDPVELLRDSTAWGNKTLQRLLSVAASRFGADDEDLDETPEDDTSGNSRSGSSNKGKKAHPARRKAHPAKKATSPENRPSRRHRGRPGGSQLTCGSVLS